MKKESLSLLDQIKSKYILQKILCLAYGEMKSVLKLVKYNKSLLNKLDINFEENYKYKYGKDTKVYKDIDCSHYILFSFDIIFFILFLIYITIFYVKEKFNDKNLKEGYNVKKKKFVDFMDNYILLAYFGYIIASIIIFILYFYFKSFVLKGYIKLIIFVLICFVDLTHYITYIIKFAFSIKLINKEKRKIIWFYGFDITIIIFLSLYIVIFMVFFYIIFHHVLKMFCMMIAFL